MNGGKRDHGQIIMALELCCQIKNLRDVPTGYITAENYAICGEPLFNPDNPLGRIHLWERL